MKTISLAVEDKAGEVVAILHLQTASVVQYPKKEKEIDGDIGATVSVDSLIDFHNAVSDYFNLQKISEEAAMIAHNRERLDVAHLTDALMALGGDENARRVGANYLRHMLLNLNDRLSRLEARTTHND